MHELPDVLKPLMRDGPVTQFLELLLAREEGNKDEERIARMRLRRMGIRIIFST